jgi:hypothetical protein
VWFYDGSAGTPTLYAGLYASNSTTNDGYGVNVADWSGSNYIWHGPGINETPTFVGRTVGWHEFTLEVTDTGFQAKVDQTIVGTVAGDFAFDTVQLLLSGPGGSPATFYFDDFEFAAPDSNVAYDACLLYDPAKVVRQNATVPIKLQACDANRANLSGPELPVIAVDVLRVSNDSEGELDDSGNANPDMNFRYDGTLEGYIFNLSTRQLTPGSYVLRFTIGEDPTLHSAAFPVR